MKVIVEQATGKILFSINGNEETIKLNTPANCVAVDAPPRNNMYLTPAGWQDIPPCPEGCTYFDYVSKTWVDTRSIDEVREHKWEKIKIERDQLEFGGFEFQGNIYDSDQVSQGRILGAANLGIDQVWTLADNSTVYLNSDELSDLYAALQEHISNVHERSRIARERIESAKTTPEIEAVTL